MNDATINQYSAISQNEIALYCGNTIVIFDSDDYPLVSKYQWSIGSHGYATCGAGKRQLLMHRLVMNVADGNYVIDHVNRVKVDNRKNNLRLCTPAQNAWNKSAQQNSKTKYRGICELPNGRFQAQIVSEGKAIYLGQYKGLKDAVIAYDSAQRIIAGDFSCPNDPTNPIDKGVFQRLKLIHHRRHMDSKTKEFVFDMKRNGLSTKAISKEVGYSYSSVLRLLNGKTYGKKDGELL